jgi:hypothetical protein
VEAGGKPEEEVWQRPDDGGEEEHSSRRKMRKGWRDRSSDRVTHKKKGKDLQLIEVERS